MAYHLTRRAMLGQLTALAAIAAVPAGLPRQALAASDEFARLDATAQAELVRRGDVSALELIDAAIARIEALDEQLNAVTTRLFERAREAARSPLLDGPFSGVPYLIKDLDNLAGVPTTMGSRLFAEFTPDQSDPYVLSTLTTGLVPVGKSNTPEFGLLGTTESLLLGACRNPWNPDYTPGGSSGGAAAAVAAGLVPFAHATDGGGSIRIPAACCGLFGLKPSRGRLAPEQRAPIDLSAQHCVSRSVRDSARLFAATEYRGANADLPPTGMVSATLDRPLRVGLDLTTLLGSQPHPEVAVAAQQAARLCTDLGHHVEVAQTGVNGSEFVHHFITVWASMALGPIEQARQQGLDPEAVLEPWTLGLARDFEARGEHALEQAIGYFDASERLLDAFFQRYDVLLTPVLAAPPVRIGAQQPEMLYEDLYKAVTEWVSYTPLHNAAGTPAMSVPLAWTPNDLPIGVQFAAARGNERTLFELAYQLEDARPWANHWPTVTAA